MAFIRIPPDSTGKQVHTKQGTVDAQVVQTQAVHLADPHEPTQYQKVDNRGAASVRFSEGQPIMSGFGSLKIAGQRVLGVYESSTDSYDDLFTVEEITGGTNVFDDVAHAMVLTTTGATGSRVVRTTNRYHYYLPGSSNLVLMTATFGDTGKVGNSRRIGLFDDLDGIFFELKDLIFGVNLRSSTSGSVVNTFIPQSLWNGDKLDGTGTSGITLDITKFNVFWIDYQWLGAGRVRFGIYEANGARLVCHTIENAGNNPLSYMRTGTLPFRTENVNTGTTGIASVLREGCLAIYTEGDFSDYTFWRNADMSRTGATVNATDTHLLTLKSKTLINNHHNSVQCYPENLSVYTDQPVAITLWQSTTLTGATFSVTSDSSIDGAIDGTLSTVGARKFKTLFFGPGAHTISLTDYFEVNDEGIMCAANGVADLWSFTGKKLGATDATVTMCMCYRELW